MSKKSNSQCFKIDIVVHGRFHAFELARALIEDGHDVIVLTNYPKFIGRRFGLPVERMVTFLTHGVLLRILNPIKRFALIELIDNFIHSSFGRWAANNLRNDVDIVYGFSGVMEEALLSRPAGKKPFYTLVRGSTHICLQNKILEDEEKRVGTKIDKPSKWILHREQREYQIADQIIVLSSYCKLSFLNKNIKENKVSVLLPGISTDKFSLTDTESTLRIERIHSKRRLRVLTCGSFSFRKGAYDYFLVAQALADKFEFVFVGDFPNETEKLRINASKFIEFNQRVREHKLKDYYKDADIFFFPSLEEGSASVLRQALAAGLPILATENSGAADFIKDEYNGFIFPIRSAPLFIEKLNSLHSNREQLLLMSKYASESAKAMEWSISASKFIDIVRSRLQSE